MNDLAGPVDNWVPSQHSDRIIWTLSKDSSSPQQNSLVWKEILAFTSFYKPSIWSIQKLSFLNEVDPNLESVWEKRLPTFWEINKSIR